MHVINFLIKEGTAQGDLMLDAAMSGQYGGLVSAAELGAAIAEDKSKEGALLRKLLEKVPGDRIVAKAYIKNGEVKVVGVGVHAQGKAWGVFGEEIPAEISTDKTSEVRGTGNYVKEVPFARFVMNIEGKFATLDFEFVKPKELDYTEWCAWAVTLEEGDIVDALATWEEPVLLVGSTRVSLTDIPPGVYRLLALESSEEISKKNTPYTAWVATLQAADCEFKTWKAVLNVGRAETRALERGTPVYFESRGTRVQIGKDGKPVINPNAGAPFLELKYQIYGSSEDLQLSPLKQAAAPDAETEPESMDSEPALEPVEAAIAPVVEPAIAKTGPKKSAKAAVAAAPAELPW